MCVFGAISIENGRLWTLFILFFSKDRKIMWPTHTEHCIFYENYDSVHVHGFYHFEQKRDFLFGLQRYLINLFEITFMISFEIRSHLELYLEINDDKYPWKMANKIRFEVMFRIMISFAVDFSYENMRHTFFLNRSLKIGHQQPTMKKFTINPNPMRNESIQSWWMIQLKGLIGVSS